MAKKKNDKPKVYVGKLYRFGYELMAVGFTEKEVRDAIEKEYVKTYKIRNNGSNPKKDIFCYYTNGGSGTYYDVAMEEVGIYEMEVGKVEWC